jgi:hypothetical protein
MVRGGRKNGLADQASPFPFTVATGASLHRQRPCAAWTEAVEALSAADGNGVAGVLSVITGEGAPAGTPFRVTRFAFLCEAMLDQHPLVRGCHLPEGCSGRQESFCCELQVRHLEGTDAGHGLAERRCSGSQGRCRDAGPASHERGPRAPLKFQ